MSDPASTRHDPRFDVQITVDWSTRDMFLSNHVTNLSKGGLFIETPTPLPLNSEVFLRLTLPDVDAVVETKGRVIWTFDVKKGTARVLPGMGIKLTDTSPQHREQLEAYLSRLDPPKATRSSGPAAPARRPETARD